ncbi:MAG TPA: hypothetical protein VES19_16515 [Candidatus Limnocylindrales bacterium]|nr:hypothetical protein [Candidatus Limnocylindrales bacterium]
MVIVLGACDASDNPNIGRGPSDRDWHGPDLFGGAAIVSKDPGGGSCTNSGPATLRIDASGAAVLTVKTTGDIVRDNAGACAVLGEETTGYFLQGIATVGNAAPIEFATCGSKGDKQATGTARVLPGGASATGKTEIEVSCAADGQMLYRITASLDRLPPK